MANIDHYISVIVPFHNAAGYLSAFVDELVAVVQQNFGDYEILFIDDGSEDQSCEIIDQKLSSHRALRLIQLSREYGESIAVSVGLNSAIGDFALVLNPNSDPPAVIPALLERALAGADVIYGVDRTGRERGPLERVLSFGFHWYADRFLHITVPKHLTSLRCLSRDAINALTRFSDPHTYHRYVGSVIGFRSETFEYQSIVRDRSARGRSVGKAINEGLQIITENSPHPLRVVTLFGLTLATLNLLYMGYIVLIFLFKKNVLQGWTTLSMQISVLFMCVILILTALSEYIGRILQKIQNRPSWFVREERASKVMIATPRLNVVSTDPKERA